MARRHESPLEMIWAFAVRAFWRTLDLFERTSAPIDFKILEGVPPGTQLRMVLRRDATRGALVSLSLTDRGILELDERSREKLMAVIGNHYKWPNPRYRSFTMRTLQGFTRAEFLRRKLLIGGLKKLEVTIQPRGKFGVGLRLVVSR